MLPCPDCDSTKMSSVAAEGDGKCSICHGTGSNGFLESISELLGGEEEPCDSCQGTGQCQACGGTGIIEEYLPGAVA